jgi:putative transposase
LTCSLDKNILKLGKPATIRCDHDPAISNRHFLAWTIEQKTDVVHIRPGMPAANAYVGSFHGRFRDECLNTIRKPKQLTSVLDDFRHQFGWS